MNSQDYPTEEMEALAASYDVERARRTASYAHTYVAFEGDTVIGTGSISSFWGGETERILLMIFILPEYHGKSVGRRIVKTLETDE